MTTTERVDDHIEWLNESTRTGRFQGFAMCSPKAGLRNCLPGRGPATRAKAPHDIAATCAEVFGGRPLRVVVVIAAGTKSATYNRA